MSQAEKKIFHIIQSLSNGGCENMLLRTLPCLTDFEHKIITLKEPGELALKFIHAGISVHWVRCVNFLDIFGIQRLRRIIKKEKPDIMITYLFHADMLGRLALRGTTQAPVIPFLRTTYNHPRYLIARILEWLTKPLVSKYFANSEAVKNFYVNHIGVQQANITVIPNGIDIAHFNTLIQDPELRKSLSINPENFVIICVANLHTNKGHRYLLEAFESLRQTNTKLLLIGDGPERQNLEYQIMKYRYKGNIQFLGKRTDVPELLKISNLFILPTLFEGMSNAIMEAMASGLPVITTNIPENIAWLSHGKTALLIQERSSKSIRTAINTIQKSAPMRTMLIKNARSAVVNDFSLDSIACRWESSLLSQ